MKFVGMNHFSHVSNGFSNTQEMAFTFVPIWGIIVTSERLNHYVSPPPLQQMEAF